MTKANHKVKTKKPVPAIHKPLKAEYKDFFKALGKGVAHAATGKWTDIGTDAVEALAAVGLKTEPGELAHHLVHTALKLAVVELVRESFSHLSADAKDDSDDLIEQMDFTGMAEKIPIDRKFFDRPADLPMLEGMKTILHLWLANHGVGSASATAIADRLPSYYVYALSVEWRRNLKSYKPLFEAIDTPFTKAGDREWGWAAYAALLQRRVQECVFDEPFSLSQIYIPLNAFYLEEKSGKSRGEETMRIGEQSSHVVIELEQELEAWLCQSDSADAIRIISGGPGSGKSSFARIFAAQIADQGKVKVLFVPLHLIDPAKDLSDEIGRFVRDEGILAQNPLDAESPESHLLIILDGLDEVASQGKAAAETARNFVREVEKTVQRRNLQTLKLRILLSGRELVVQENESEFRRPRQILTLLPYVPDGTGYNDPRNLLEQDKRQDWWKNYGKLTGRNFEGLPEELIREDLKEVTAQPLLNYLIALSYTRDKLDFSKDDINLNSVYEDLVKAVHERGYEKRRAHSSIRDMKLEDFFRVLEEVGLASWHGDGRTTTVKEIETHCRNSGLDKLLEVFKEGAEAGVTRLLAAFFFRQYGRRDSGDPTFVFTHKSFGEYLTARRVVRAIEKMVLQLKRRNDDPDDGWDEREALKRWTEICGPSAMTNYLHEFLQNEIGLRPIEQVKQWQGLLAKLFNYMLRYGMPMEKLQIGTFQESLFQARNSEEALLLALNSCAVRTKERSFIELSEPASFGIWFRRIQGEKCGGEAVLAAKCLAYLDLQGASVSFTDFYSAKFSDSNLQHIQGNQACFDMADLRHVTLQEGIFERATFRSAALTGANLKDSKLVEADLKSANLEGANLEGANLGGGDFRRANLKKANLKKANLEGANLEGAILEGAILEGAILEGAILPKEFPKTEESHELSERGF